MRPRALVLVGLLLLLASVALVVAAALVRGPLEPACEGRPLAAGCAAQARVVSLALRVGALPLALAGALAVGMGIARASPDPRDAEGPSV